MTIQDVMVERLIVDLTDRRGLRQAWEEIDEVIQKEIREKWAQIIQDEMIRYENSICR